MIIFLRKIFFLTFFIILISINSFSQTKTDTSSLFMINTAYSLQLPGGDLSNRFGINSAIGLGTMYKTKNNWLLYGFWDYKFGNQLTDESTNIFDNIKTSSGQIINQDGEYGIIHLSERGFSASINFGKIIPVKFESNNYSGLLFYVGPYFLQHKIYIENDGNNIPEVIGDYRKGYDRLTNGFGINEFIGYIHNSNTQIFNFFAGFEFSQAFTKNRRSFDFYLRTADTQNRKDYLFSFKVGFNVLLSKRKTNNYYYF